MRALRRHADGRSRKRERWRPRSCYARTKDPAQHKHRLGLGEGWSELTISAHADGSPRYDMLFYVGYAQIIRWLAMIMALVSLFLVSFVLAHAIVPAVPVPAADAHAFLVAVGGLVLARALSPQRSRGIGLVVLALIVLGIERLCATGQYPTMYELSYEPVWVSVFAGLGTLLLISQRSRRVARQ